MTHKHNGKWKPVELGDLIDIFDSIRVPLNSRQRAERQGRFPYYGASGVIDSVDDYLFDGEYVLVAEDGENLNSRKLPVAFMARGQFWVNNHAHIIKGKKGIADDRFLIGWFAQADIKGYITGAAQPKLSQANLKRIALTAPPFPVQRKIAGVLSAYDDLIENNTRRIAILEEMAQAIYREWFVNFRFPGHEKVKLINSPLGKIPEGWKWAKLKDVCDSVNYGYTASANKEVEVGPRFLRITDIVPTTIDWENVPYCEVDDDDASKYALHEGDIVIARTGATTGYAKRLHKRHPKSVFASYLVRIVPNEAMGKHYIGLIVESDDYKAFIKRNLGGAAQPQANAQVLTSLDVLVPSPDVIAAFDCQVEPLADQKEILQVKNRNLRKTRDLLLPKLISGQLDVEELDIDTGEPLVAATT